MANIFDYLTWRADVPFSVDPFHEVDNLVLCELAYTDFGGIVPAGGREIPLTEARDAFFAKHTREELLAKSSFTAKAPLLMDGMVSGERFRNATLSGYVNEIDRERDAQFSAITVKPGDGSVFIAYRGTDGTVVGWKEDFDLSYVTETEGQRRAVRYLDDTAARLKEPLRVGGHSKGGNFAVYASAFCGRAAQDRILTVFSNDGPGFREETVASAAYARILPRLVSIVPDTSIIGLLLASGAEHRVIRSTATGIVQHDGFSWCVERNRFVGAELSEMGRFIEQALGAWIGEMDEQTRKSFTSTVFSIFESTGEETFHAMSEQKWKSAEAILSSVRALPKERRGELARLAGRLLQSGSLAAQAQIAEKK